MLVKWLPYETFEKLYRNNLNGLIDYYYEIYNDQINNINNPIMFESKPVVINTRTFDCKDKFVKEGKNCNNTLFQCSNCPFLQKDEMFFHIVSNKDPEIEKKLKKDYRKKLRNRVPGMFSKKRLVCIKWVRTVIEEYEKKQKSRHLLF